MLSFSEACERNKDPILAVLRVAFAACRDVLEIGSGTGQHAVYFSSALPHLNWQPTERAENLPDLKRRVEQQPLVNLRAPLELDVRQAAWPVLRTDAVFSANTLHIMSWEAVVPLFEGLGRVLHLGGTACIYGPFNYEGRHTSPSNERFDVLLRGRDPASGIRDLCEVKKLAARHGLQLVEDHDLPANNRLVVFRKSA